MSEPGTGPRRIPPRLIAITAVILIAGSIVHNWRQEALVAAIEDSLLTLAIVAGLLALLAAIELLLHDRARLWGRIAGLAAVSAVLFWRLFHTGSKSSALLAGIIWAGMIGGLVVLMLRNPGHRG